MFRAVNTNSQGRVTPRNSIIGELQVEKLTMDLQATAAVGRRERSRISHFGHTSATESIAETSTPATEEDQAEALCYNQRMILICEMRSSSEQADQIGDLTIRRELDPMVIRRLCDQASEAENGSHIFNVKVSVLDKMFPSETKATLQDTRIPLMKSRLPAANELSRMSNSPHQKRTNFAEALCNMLDVTVAVHEPGHEPSTRSEVMYWEQWSFCRTPLVIRVICEKMHDIQEPSTAADIVVINYECPVQTVCRHLPELNPEASGEHDMFRLSAECVDEQEALIYVINPSEAVLCSTWVPQKISLHAPRGSKNLLVLSNEAWSKTSKKTAKAKELYFEISRPDRPHAITKVGQIFGSSISTFVYAMTTASVFVRFCASVDSGSNDYEFRAAGHMVPALHRIEQG